MINIEIELHKKQLKLIEKKLGSMSDKTLDVLKKAVNDTAKDTRILLSKEARKKYTVKSSRFNNAMNIKKATKRNPEALITASGKMLELNEFKVSPNKYKTGNERPDHLKAKALKNSSMKDLIWSKHNIKAFVVIFSNGHPAVVERHPGEEYTIGKNRRKAKYGEKQDMTKIDTMLSLSVPYMLGDKKTYYKTIKPYIKEQLKINIDKHIQKVLASGGS